MHSIQISSKTAENKPLWRDLLDHGAKLRAQGAKVYTNSVRVKNQTFTFITTTKDLALEMASMGDLGRGLLAMLLEEEIARLGDQQLLVSVSLKDGQPESDRSVILVTRTPEEIGERVNFHISQAH